MKRGERIDTSWERARAGLIADAPAELRRSMLDGEFPFVLQGREPHVVRIDGVDYPIGRGIRLEVARARLSRPLAAWKKSGTTPDGAVITLVPGSSNRAVATLIPS